MAARARPSTPKTLERKRSKGYAPRLDALAASARRIFPLTLSRRAGPARGAPKSKPLSPALPAPRPAKVKPPIKLPVPVIDARLRISFSKVPPLLFAVL